MTDDSESHITPLDESHTLSEKQAVMTILGYRGDFLFGNEDEIFEYTLNDYIYDLQETADIEYRDALFERHDLEAHRSVDTRSVPGRLGELESEIESKKNALLKTEDTVHLAETYLHLLKDAVVRTKKGEDTKLVIDPDESAKHGCTHITKASLQKWLETNAEEVQALSPSTPSALRENMRNGGLSPTKKENLLATLGLLTRVFSETARKFQNGDKPNVSAIARNLEDYAKKVNDSDGLPGQSCESIKSRIEHGLKALKEKLPGG